MTRREEIMRAARQAGSDWFVAHSKLSDEQLRQHHGLPNNLMYSTMVERSAYHRWMKATEAIGTLPPEAKREAPVASAPPQPTVNVSQPAQSASAPPSTPAPAAKHVAVQAQQKPAAPARPMSQSQNFDLLGHLNDRVERDARRAHQQIMLWASKRTRQAALD